MEALEEVPTTGSGKDGTLVRKEKTFDMYNELQQTWRYAVTGWV